MEAGRPSDGAPGVLEVSIESLRGLHVAVATPCYGNAYTEQYLGALARTQRRFDELGIPFSAFTGKGASIERNRNQLVARFLANNAWTHLLFIDADQGWEPEAVLRLLAIGHDVIGVPVLKKTEAQAWNVNVFRGADGNPLPLAVERSAVEVADIGTGFFMVSRAALELMCEKYPDLKIDDRETPFGEHLFALFARSMPNDVSEDYTFCRRWRAIGGRVWADPESEIVHVGQREWRGRFADCLAGGEGDRAREADRDARVPDGGVAAHVGAGEPVEPVAETRKSASVAIQQAIGLRLTPDGARYLRMAAGVREPMPFHLRWLLPAVLGTNTTRWCWASWASLALTVPLVGLLALQWGATTSAALLAAALWAALPSVRFQVAAPVLVDAPAMLLAVGAAVLTPIDLPAAVTLAFIAGMVSEKAPIFAACFAWSPFLLVGLLAPLAMCAVRPGKVADDDPLRHTLLQPLATGIASHAATWRDAATMLLPWGACLAALAAPDPRWIVPAVIAYAQLLVATDTTRLVQMAGPAVCIAAAMVIPPKFALVALVAHVVNPMRGDGL